MTALAAPPPQEPGTPEGHGGGATVRAERS
jgi:hypothetical protein